MFHIYRIIGNDLPVRHSPTQSEDNLRFILENEALPSEARRIFILNRIADLPKQARLIKILQEYKSEFFAIRFDFKLFKSLPTYLDQVKYATNVNPARNYCLDMSRQSLDRPTLTVPLDGNCMFVSDGYEDMARTAAMNRLCEYFYIPMCRCTDYCDVFEGRFSLKENYKYGDMQIVGAVEPQLAFRNKNNTEKFNPDLEYGRVDKAELLFRLGIEGIWTRWIGAAVDKIPSRIKLEHKPLPAGFVCRLPSGNVESDTNNQARGAARAEGLKRLIKSIK